MNQALELSAHPISDSLKVVYSLDKSGEQIITTTSHDRRSLVGSENLKIENVDIPTLRSDEALHPRKSGIDLRHGPD